ncbi:MAG: multidrug efflux RND transporter permease subunit [bacterium]|nr:multidrug efflux RND transporter permease subunit [bacterium]
MAKFFIHRPVLSIVISLVILIAGGVCIPNLPIAQYPEICPPVIQVSTQYAGANAQVVEETVASSIEQQINGAEGMLYMRSVCTNQGYYTLQITFDLDRDQDMAMVDVKNRVALATPLLPAEVNAVGVNVDKQSTQNLMYISIYSGDKSRDSLFLSNYATLNIKDQLARVNGVGKVQLVAGQRDYAMRIWAQPDRMSQLRITCDDIIGAINTQSVQAPAGSIGDPPQKQKVQMQYPVNVKGRLTKPEEFANCIVATSGNNSYLRIKDVARTELGASSYNSQGKRDDSDALIIAIYQQPSANSVELAKSIRVKMEELSQYFPTGVNYEITYDCTIFVTKSIEEVVHTLFEAIVLVLIVVMVFLGNFRATLIPILAVPVSLVGTFAGFAVMGFTINLLTMFGLVLAVGIVVDDAIVVVEAVELHIEHGMAPLEATEKAMEEVSGPVMAIALVLCAVFVPVAFMGGMTGTMYKQFAITLAVSVMLSAVVALTMTPALCAIILKPRSESNGLISKFFGLFFGIFNKCFNWLTSIYVFVVRWCIKLVLPALALLAVIYGGAYELFTHTPTGFIPNEDMGNIIVCAILPDGASLDRTQTVCDRVNAIVRKHSAVEHTISLAGFNAIQGNFASNGGAVIAVLKDWDKRPNQSDNSLLLAQTLQGELSSIREATIMCVCPPPVSGLSQTGGVTLELQDRASSTAQNLSNVANAFCMDAMTKKAASVAYTFFRPSVPLLNVDVDRDKLMGLGIPINSAFTAMQVNLGGYFINQYNDLGRTWNVYLQADSQYRRTPSDIGKIYLRSSTSRAMVPLSNVSRVSETTGPDVLIRYNMYRAAEINAEPMPGSSSGQTIAALEQLSKQLPQGFGYEWTSTAFQEKQASGQTTQILVFGLVFVFLFLAAQYESWGVPFAVLLSMPTVIFGALIGVNLVGLDLNIYVQIGMLTLIGLSAKNAILIVEYAKANYEKGMDLLEATVEGARLRFRPILMTSFAFIMGVVPLARAVGASAVCRKALGISVMSGMLAATILGVVIIPALYVFVQRLITLFTGDTRKVKACTPENDVVPAAVKETAQKDEATPKAKAETADAEAAPKDGIGDRKV